MDDWKPVVGKIYRINFGEESLYNKKIYILAIVDEEYYVYKYWWKYKQRWLYEIESLSYLQMLYERGHLKK